MRVRKAIIAAAGFGTRFLPQTKAMPKEMLPLIDKPVIQYVVEELVSAGIQDIIIVTGYSKRSIEDHFDYPNQDLVANLKAGGEAKAELLDEVRQIANLANFIYVRQKGPYGLATPILSAAHLIGDEPFIFTLADDFFVAETGRTKQLIEVHEQYQSSVFACKKVINDVEYDRYGIAAGENIDENTIKMSTIIEKPGKQNAPSDMASVSGYLFTPDVIKYVEKAAESHTDGELMLQPIVQKMIDDGHDFYARKIVGAEYFDTGTKLEYLKTVFNFALKNEKMAEPLKDYLRTML
ncbi:NTP transferase domain-containing protein [Candidatus Saccharibacteria bacterium]|nr:MAG: NTP transferase domain-containing protein [Candidatus Saccharibacteria bacterium]